jgi:hypothetical protein
VCVDDQIKKTAPMKIRLGTTMVVTRSFQGLLTFDLLSNYGLSYLTTLFQLQRLYLWCYGEEGQ